MSDTHEEQLLSDLLRNIASEDAGLDAAHLEARVISAADGPTETVRVRLKADTTYFAIAAAVAVAVLVPAMFRTTPQATDETIRLKADNPTEVVVTAPKNFAAAALAPRRATPTNRTRPTSPTNLTNLTTPTPPPSVEEFVPLMPMTDQELAGPFQLVRVQMPRASLGALRSPLDHPNELVEADVLLGEDGMARAIRVSTNGALYPWRSR